MISIRELTADAEIDLAFALMSLLRDRIQADSFLDEIRSQQADGYRLIGGFNNDRLVALAGIRRSATLSRGPHLFVDDLVVDPAARSAGYGREMLRWIIANAAAQGLPRVYLDSRDTARGFYKRVGFTVLTSIPCWIDVPPPPTPSR